MKQTIQIVNICLLTKNQGSLSLIMIQTNVILLQMTSLKATTLILLVMKMVGHLSSAMTRGQHILLLLVKLQDLRILSVYMQMKLRSSRRSLTMRLLISLLTVLMKRLPSLSVSKALIRSMVYIGVL